MNKFLIGFALFIGLVSCGPDPEETLSTEESDVVLTLGSDTTDFARYKTYSIVDSVLTVGDNGESERVLGEVEKTLIEELKSQYASRNYELVDTSANPDFFVDVFAFKFTTTETVWYPGYWGGGCWYYPCYGGWYPWYGGGGGYSYSYETGSVAVDMYSLIDESPVAESYFVPWHIYLRGILSSNVITNKSRVQTNIKRAFDQSPYLVTLP